MSEIKTLDVEVSFPDILDVDVDFGQTLTKIVAPERYMGPFEFHVSDEDQIIPVKEKTPVENICVKGITGEKTITENGTYDTLADKTVVVDVPQRFTLDNIADKSALKNLGEITINLTKLSDDAFHGWSFETIHLPNLERFPLYYPFNSYGQTGVKYVDMPNVYYLGKTFYGQTQFLGTYGDGDGVLKLKKVTHVTFDCFYQCSKLKKVYFYKKATLDDRPFHSCSGITDIYVPWSTGEVSGAPWGATNATIHYDTVYDEDGNVVSST